MISVNSCARIFVWRFRGGPSSGVEVLRGTGSSYLAPFRVFVSLFLSAPLRFGGLGSSGANGEVELFCLGISLLWTHEPA